VLTRRLYEGHKKEMKYLISYLYKSIN